MKQYGVLLMVLSVAHQETLEKTCKFFHISVFSSINGDRNIPFQECFFFSPQVF